MILARSLLAILCLSYLVSAVWIEWDGRTLTKGMQVRLQCLYNKNYYPPGALTTPTYIFPSHQWYYWNEVVLAGTTDTNQFINFEITEDPTYINYQSAVSTYSVSGWQVKLRSPGENNQNVYVDSSTRGVMRIGTADAFPFIFADKTYNGQLTTKAPYIWLVQPALMSNAPYPNGCTSAVDLMQCSQPTGHWSWVDYSMNLAAKYKVWIDVLSPSTPWACYPGIDVPIRLNSAGDVECMATDGANCLWSGSCNTVLSQYATANLSPLSCGDMHRSLYGMPGYDSPPHWCYKGWELMKPWLCLPTITTPIRLNPQGNPECLANNARDCYWGTVSCDKITVVTPTTTVINPLVCGNGHYNTYGDTGYYNPIHWCYKSVQILESQCMPNNQISFCTGSSCTGMHPCPQINS